MPPGEAGFEGAVLNKSRIVPPQRTGPGDAGRARFFDRNERRPMHDQMAHAIIAVDQRHRRAFAIDADVGLEVQTPCFDPLDVLRQSNTPWPSDPLTSASAISAPTGLASAIGMPTRDSALAMKSASRVRGTLC